MADFVRHQRCVDDTLHHDHDLSTHWWRTIELLNVLNAEKFQFAQRSVDFAGFRIKEASIKPLPKYLDAIRHFPRPTSITDVRSCFGLVNQVSHYAQLREIMTPFKHLLSPKTRFEWTDSLDATFRASKNHIIDSIREGVKIFDVSRRTCLRTD